MRSDLVTQRVEQIQEGFAALPPGIGLGVEVNEDALRKYEDKLA
jgi:L-alanine-DL-glutamate epimerase-like enolase superfamily enzyme